MGPQADMPSDSIQERLEEDARWFAPVLFESLEQLLPRFLEAICGKSTTRTEKLRQELAGELLAFSLHSLDRQLFVKFGADGRKAFMDVIVLELLGLLAVHYNAELAERFPRRYNDRQSQYGVFERLVPEEGKGYRNTLFWEFGKLMVGQYASKLNPAAAMMTATLGMDVFGLLATVVKELPH